MVETGHTLTGHSGRSYKVGRELPSGGQGRVFEVDPVPRTHHQPMIGKLFHAPFQNADTRKRLQFMMRAGLSELCPAICSPVDLVDGHGVLGHVAPKVPGAPLEQVLQRPDLSFQDGLQIAAVVAHTFAVLHENGIAHGDPHANNVLAQPHSDGSFEVHLIDLDNFAAPGLPAPPCIGQTWYMAPELRRRTSLPSVETDRFALSVIMHEILLRRHIAEDDTEDADRFHETMLSGVWLQDPLRASADTATTGFPVTILDAGLMRLFRGGISDNPGSRPSALEWRDALVRTMSLVYSCPGCGGPNVVDTSKSRCPHCGIDYPRLKLTGNFGTIELTGGSTTITRELLGGASTVSSRHAVIRRIGPEYRLEDLSANGTFRFAGDRWIRLPQSSELMHQPLIACGERLRFADVEAQLQLA